MPYPNPIDTTIPLIIVRGKGWSPRTDDLTRRGEGGRGGGEGRGGWEMEGGEGERGGVEEGD